MKIFGQHDEQTVIQFQDARSRAVDAALMADGHVGYVMPIGGVAAYRDQVSVVGVGFDVACGNAAIRTDLHIEDDTGIAERLDELADEIEETVSFGIGRNGRHPSWLSVQKAGRVFTSSGAPRYTCCMTARSYWRAGAASLMLCPIFMS